MKRSKPGIETVPDDYLDEIAESAAEHERTQHEVGECLDGCQHCEVEADLLRENKARQIFDRLWGDWLALMREFKENKP